MLFGGLREKLPRIGGGADLRADLRRPPRDHRGDRGAAADRLRLPAGAALRADRLDHAGDVAAHAQQHRSPSPASSAACQYDSAVIRRLALVVGVAALLAVPATAAAAPAKEGGRAGRPSRRSRSEAGSPGRDGHGRTDRPARRQGDDPRHGAGSPARSSPTSKASTSKSPSTVNGKKVVAHQVAIQPGAGRNGDLRIERRRQGRRQVRGRRQARRDRGARRRLDRAQELDRHLPEAEPRRMRPRRRGLQSRTWRRWATSAAAASASPRGSAARCSPTARSTTWTGPKRPARAWSGRSSPARAATTSSTRTPANTPRCRSPSRSWC